MTTEPCSSCGAQAMVERYGDIYQVSCAECGSSYAYHSSTLQPPLAPSDLEPVQVLVRWASGRPSHHEFKVLRSLFPHLQALSIADLYAETKGTDRFSLGTHPSAYANRLRAEAAALEVMLVVADGHAQPTLQDDAAAPRGLI